MTTVVRIADYRTSSQRRPDTRFDRQELDQLLSIYSRRVINGEWKDYAICHEPDRVSFRVYRSASHLPSFTLVKRCRPDRTTEFVLYHGRQRITKSVSLTDALSILNPKIRLVTS